MFGNGKKIRQLEEKIKCLERSIIRQIANNVFEERFEKNIGSNRANHFIVKHGDIVYVDHKHPYTKYTVDVTPEKKECNARLVKVE
jgi:hypothetical protein